MSDRAPVRGMAARGVRNTAAAGLVGVVVALSETVRLLAGVPEASQRDYATLLGASLSLVLGPALLTGAAIGLLLAALGDPLDQLSRAALLIRAAVTAPASRVLATALGVALGAGALLGFHYLALGPELGRSPQGAAGLRAGLAAVAGPVIAWLGGAALLPPLERGFGARDGSRGARSLAWLGLLAAAGALVGAGLRRFGPVLESVDWTLPSALLFAAALWPLADGLAARARPWLRWVAMVLLPPVLGGLCALGLFQLGQHPVANEALQADRGILGQGLPVAQRLLDRDGDGYSGLLGGGDCDERDPSVHPAANDLPGNGRDEDCDGEDLALLVPPPAPVPPPPPPAAPAAATPRPSQPPPRHNLVLISVDTLRPDHLGAWGYARPTSPNIDALALRSRRFERAYSLSNKTPSVIASLISGRYPSEHPRTFAHFNTYLPDNVFLAERLAAQGYRTWAVVSHWYFEPKFGLGQGFATWEVVKDTRERMEKVPSAEEVSDRALAALRELEGGEQPFHLWLHYIDPHKLYIPHEGFPAFGKRAVDRYDGEIVYTDFHLGRFLDALYASPAWDRTVVALIADHGEAFGEHGEWHHGWSVHEHQIRVPFLLRVPGLEPGVEAARVSLVDLVPTLLDLAGVDSPGPPPLRGRSLLPELRAPAQRVPRPLYAEVFPGPHNAAWSAYIEGDVKLIHRWRGNVFTAYDLATDPGEERNLFSSDPARAKALRQRYQLWRQANVSPVEPRRAP